ncbi:ParB N-terminal domain-containing protein [Streptomyces sp. NPDC046374]|uniref:ParB N-terminal domain-containing protein n=1 Tax=Streptomyces sp. NPDC046374 TaxID=3154917 RepID=UPI0033C87E84
MSSKPEAEGDPYANEDTTQPLPKPVIVQRDPRNLKRLEINARFMRKEQFDRLVRNIKRDGCLTSLPLIWREGDDDEERELVLSGNHRTDAAVAAGLETIDCMLIVGPLSDARRLGLQLSHNAIAGEDDMATLAMLYEQIDDLDWREYSGLDDKTLNLMAEVNLEGISEANLNFQTVQLVFLPQELQAAKEAFQEAKAPADERWVAAYKDYDRLIDALNEASGAHNVGNLASTLGVVLAVFENHLEDLAEGFLGPDGEALHSGRVGWAAVAGTRVIPAKSAAVLTAAMQRAEHNGETDKGSGWQILEKLAAQYLEQGQKAVAP